MGIGNTKKQAEEAHREIQRLRQQLTTLQTENEMLNEQYASLERVFKEFADERDELKAEKERLEGELGRLREYRELAQKYIGLAKLFLNKEKPEEAKRFLQECSLKMNMLDEHPTQEPTNG